MRKITRKAQMEMIGLAFVVILVVLGLLLYIAFQSTGGSRVSSHLIRQHSNFGISLESAMLETSVPECGFPLSVAIQSCMKNPTLHCGYLSVCDATHNAIEGMLDAAIGDTMSYRATLEQAGNVVDSDTEGPFLFPSDPDDQDCPEEADMYAAPSQSISLNPGTVELVIGFCS